MTGDPINGFARPGCLILSTADGYYGILLKQDPQTRLYTVFLGNGLTVELKRDQFVLMPLRHGQSLDKNTALTSFHEILDRNLL